ncbi:MAG: hypothetical protein ACOC7S_02765 [Planctomycetota bacterium]
MTSDVVDDQRPVSVQQSLCEKRIPRRYLNAPEPLMAVLHTAQERNAVLLRLTINKAVVAGTKEQKIREGVTLLVSLRRIMTRTVRLRRSDVTDIAGDRSAVLNDGKVAARKGTDVA